MIDATLNGVDLSDACPEAVITNVTRPLLPTVRDEHQLMPGRAGSWHFTEQPGDQIITLSISVLVDDPAERRSAIRDLGEWAATLSGRVPLIISDETDRQWSVVLDSGPPMVDDEYVGTTAIAFRSLPYAEATEITTQNETATGSSDSDTFTALGEIAADPIITLTPSGGTMGGFTLVVNGESLTWTGPPTISAGQSITINTISQTVTIGANDDIELTGAFDPDDVSMADVVASAFPVIVPGSNAWSLSLPSGSTATSVAIVFVWRERFV
jgi:predicted phage tail component-like protein